MYINAGDTLVFILVCQVGRTLASVCVSLKERTVYAEWRYDRIRIIYN